jgi:hypothetical protein
MIPTKRGGSIALGAIVGAANCPMCRDVEQTCHPRFMIADPRFSAIVYTMAAGVSPRASRSGPRRWRVNMAGF